MNKQNCTRVSFAGLKHDRNKQIELTFKNLRAPCHSHSQSNLQRSQLIFKKNSNLDHIRNNSQISHSSSSTKFANAIRQKNIKQKISQRISNDCNFLLDQSFQKCQKALKMRIEQYNAKYIEITQMLADLQIKDIMKLNEMIEKNQEIYYNFLNYAQPHEPIPSFLVSSMDDSKKIYQIQRALIKIITEPTKSFDARSTYESRNKKTTSGGSSRVSPQIAKVQILQKDKLKKRLDKIEKMSQSAQSKVSQNQQNSINAKSACILNQNRSKVSNLQDTPESVKSKISFTTKIKTQKNSAIAMFQKINICESIQECFVPVPKVDKIKQKKDHRYGSGSQQ